MSARTLLDDFNELSPDQRECVLYPDNTVVLAGPGSGKTQTLAIKVAHLIRDVVRWPQSVACLTYSKDAATEIAIRLQGYGLQRSRAVHVSTLHSFCWDCIVRPFAAVVGRPDFATRRLIPQAEVDAVTSNLVEKCSVWVSREDVKRVRIAMACSQNLSSFSAAAVGVARGINEYLISKKAIDFDEMIFIAIQMLEKYPAVAGVLSSRFAWLVVDEYQDMGGPLNRIVELMIADGRTKVFVVGDPNQSIFEYAGADPTYLRQFADAHKAKRFDLKTNFRSGPRIVAASKAVLPDEFIASAARPGRRDADEIYIRGSDGADDAHGKYVADVVVPAIVASGVSYGGIAILYPKKSVGKLMILDRLCAALAGANVPYVAERDVGISWSPLLRWMQWCATWAVRFGGGSVGAAEFESIWSYYRWMGDREHVPALGSHRRRLRERLFCALTEPVDRETKLYGWMNELVEKLDLHSLVAGDVLRSDELQQAQLMCEPGKPMADMDVGDFVKTESEQNRVIVTTIHSSKGRQFDAVVLPFLHEAIVPSWQLRKGQYSQPTSSSLGRDRRLFYVGLTRARSQVWLVYSNNMVVPPDNVKRPRSRFVDEIEAKL